MHILEMIKELANNDQTLTLQYIQSSVAYLIPGDQIRLVTTYITKTQSTLNKNLF